MADPSPRSRLTVRRTVASVTGASRRPVLQFRARQTAIAPHAIDASTRRDD